MQSIILKPEVPNEVIPPEDIVRAGIKLRLSNEIPEVNILIVEAERHTKKTCRYEKRLSEESRIAFESKGYSVDAISGYTIISWEDIYNKILEDEDEIQKIISEIK